MSTPPTPTRHRTTLLLIALLLAATLPYLPALRGPFQWDDLPHISLNPNLHSLSGLATTWTNPRANIQYYPLSITAFWLEYQLFALTNLIGYHLVNLALHALNTLLVYHLLKKLRLPWPFLPALLFALHPLMVESVAYISELKNLLSGSFYLLALLLWLRATSPSKTPSEKIRWPLYAAALGAFAAGLLCKSIIATLPAAFLLLDYWQHAKIRRPILRASLPFFALALIMGLFFAHIEHAHVGAAGLDFAWTFSDRLFIATRAIFFYLGKLLWPSPLLILYPQWDLTNALTNSLLPLTLLLLLLALTLLLRKRITRGPFVALALFIITLAPALGFINYYPMLFTFVADHYCYLAAIPFFALLAGILHHIAERITKSRHTEIALAILLTIILAPLTCAQAARWRLESSLWEPAVAANRNSWAAHENLAYGYLNENRPEDAARQAAASLDLKENNARAHFTLGSALLRTGDAPNAIIHLRRGLELEPSNYPSWINLALALQQTHQLAPAEDAYRRALTLNSADPKPWNNLAALLLQRSAWPEAADAGAHAVALDPTYAPAHINLGLALRRAGNPQRAAEELQAGMILIPEDPRVRMELGMALGEAGRINEAITEYRQVIAEAPTLEPARTELAALLARTGNATAPNTPQTQK